MIIINKLLEKARSDGYEGVYANTKVAQDIILLILSKTEYNKNITLKGGVLMRSITNDIRRATQDLDIDFLAFSGHKMLGPTGVGVLYGKYEYLDQMLPINYGGGMNSFFESDKSVEYKELPLRLEAGTMNISGILGFKETNIHRTSFKS